MAQFPPRVRKRSRPRHCSSLPWINRSPPFAEAVVVSSQEISLVKGSIASSAADRFERITSGLRAGFVVPGHLTLVVEAFEAVVAVEQDLK